MASRPGKSCRLSNQSKHHMGNHHLAVCPWYLHMENSPRLLPRAQTMTALKGCVGTLEDGYLRKVPLPRAPYIQSGQYFDDGQEISTKYCRQNIAPIQLFHHVYYSYTPGNSCKEKCRALTTTPNHNSSPQPFSHHDNVQ
jgi:hypothetical protein